ncbi:MAG: S46 family peptidase, partial [Myxococcota bacterium]
MYSKTILGPALGLALVSAAATAWADEGMWTFDNFPAEKVKQAYGSAPDAAWLDHMRQSSLKLGNGCSASFISGSGLVLTNHHCMRGCIEAVSSKRRDYISRGFYAARQRDEKRCPGLSVARLEAIEDVSERVKKATADLKGEAFKKAERAEIAAIEKACATDDKTRCDVIRLYNGGRFHLYRYRNFTDVRLVFSPEDAIASFGGDPDNFEFPRYCLDMTLARVYENGKPIEVEHFLKWTETAPKADDLVYVSGHPGRTQRTKTVAQLANLRDVVLPDRLMWVAEGKGLLTEFVAAGGEKARVGYEPLFGLNNAYKAFKGRRTALLDDTFFAKLVKDELQFRQALLEKGEWRDRAEAWTEIAAAVEKSQPRRVEAMVKEHHRGFGSDLFRYAWTLVRSAQERAKPNGERLPEFGDAQLARVSARLFAPRPVHPSLEETMLRWGLTRARERLGPDDPFIRKLLDGRSPDQQARRLVKGSKLASAKVRRRLYKGGLAAIKASKDPMIVLVRAIEADGREVRAWYEREVEPVIKKNESDIADAKFALYGTTVYPDATGTLRLSFGKVAGFQHRGGPVEPFTM